jgi:transposase-like protein
MAMIMKKVRCAACGSNDVTVLENGQYKCHACGNTLTEALSPAIQAKLDTASLTGLHMTQEGKDLKRHYRNAGLPVNYAAAMDR